ncbi:MAG: hypothetical protein IH949_07880 [Bacteroidetes bacterium]|nr:hypothetical protein [Bacteroidota bacterium]
MVRADHTVYSESKAGEGNYFFDEEFEKIGAKIVFSPDEVFDRSDLLVKVAPLFGKNMKERARELKEIAYPKFRDELTQFAKENYQI